MSDSRDIRWINPMAGPVNAVVPIPGSKSITNRVLLLAALAHGTSRISGVLRSDDTDNFANGLSAMGFKLQQNFRDNDYLIDGSSGTVPLAEAKVWCGSAGTAARFLAAVAAAGHGQYHFDASPQMRKRPMDPLLNSLEIQGAGLDKPISGAFPLTINAAGLRGGKLTLGGTTVSSQYLSALLMAAPLARKPVEITTSVPVSKPYIDLTCKLMSRFGVDVVQRGYEKFEVPAPVSYIGRDHKIEADASTASYFFAAAAVTGGTVRVFNLSRSNSVQGDIRFLDILESMGCTVESDEESVTVTGPAQLRGVTVDMSDISDTVMTLACIAPYGDSTTTIQNIGHIRSKESDRISVIADGLNRLGINCEATPSSLAIHPGNPTGAVVDSFGDHRIAMAFSITGLVSPGIGILDADCVFKTCPEFFDLLARLY